MNIDKLAMETAWINRSDPKEYRRLMGYIEEMAGYFASRFKIHSNIRDDIMQEVRFTAVGAIDKYQLARKSSVFSFFYRTIYTAFIYFLRKDYNKNQKRISTCSYDVVSNTIGDDNDSNPNEPSYVCDEDKMVEVDGMVFVKEDILNAASIAKKIYRKKDLKISEIEDPLVRLCVKKLQNKVKKTRTHKQ